ncbi:MAG: hypothetical protein QW514_09000 [Thermoprotei archaeon]
MMAVVNIVVHHEWGKGEEGKAKGFFDQILKASKSNGLPSGFSLVSGYIDNAQRSAFCVWQAPSMEAFSQVAKQLNPPTRFKAYVVDKLQ